MVLRSPRMREVGSRLQTDRAPACPECVPPLIGLTRFGAHFTDPIKSAIGSSQPVRKEVLPASPGPGNVPLEAWARNKTSQGGKLLGPGTGLCSPRRPSREPKSSTARPMEISLKAAAASIHPNPLSPCTLTANPSLRASSHTPCDADIGRASVPSHPIRPPEPVDSRGAGGIVSSQGRSFGTPALGPCREPGGQLGASTPRLAPFSYRTAAKGWTSSLCPRQGRASRADLI